MIHFKLSTHLIIQGLAMTIQILNQLQVGNIIPAVWAPRVASAVAMIQALSGVIAHFSNTNGTPQELAGGAAAGYPITKAKAKAAGGGV